MAGREGKRPAPILIIIAAIVALSLVIGFAVVSSAKGLESKSNADTAEALMSSAFSGTDGGDMLAALPDGPTEYYISVSGVPVARAKTEAQLKAILDRIVSENSVENADVAYFEQDVQILFGVVSVELPNDEEEIYKLLSPSSENGLTVISEIRSDVLVATAYKTVTVDRDDLYPDQSYEVKNSGRDGLTEQFSEFTYVNGELTEKSFWEKILVLPQSHIIYSGTRVYNYGSTGTYIWPVSGKLTSYFGYRSGSIGSSNHQGIDIANSYGTTIVAADGGKVSYVGWMRGYGYIVQIMHSNGDYTYYAHLSKFLCKKGDIVAQGQAIAQMGSSGVSSGSHLHFEIRKSGTPVNPLGYLPEQN